MVPNGRIAQVLPDVIAVDVCHAAHGVPCGAFSPDPEVTYDQLVLAGDVGLTKRPGRLGASYEVLRDADESAVCGEAVLHRNYPKANGVLKGDLSRPTVKLVALFQVAELTSEDALAHLVELIVLVLPEACFTPAGHVARPRCCELVYR